MVVISNQGEVDIAALVLMGASTKEGQNKIGFFGSGNKYAIATLLRLNIPFEIYSGLDEIVITTRPVSLRDQTFDQILVNGETTSLTTRMGPDWEVWFALREFICNAKDEGGYDLSIGDITPEAGMTRIGIEETEEVLSIINDLSQYINDRPSLFYAKGDSILNKTEISGINIYRKGITVIGGYVYNSLFDYDLDILDINESRTFKYEWEFKQHIAELLATATLEVIQRYIATTDKVIEKELGYHWCQAHKLSTYWVEALNDVPICKQGYYDSLPYEDRASLTPLEDMLVNKIHAEFPQVVIWGLADEEEAEGWEEAEATQEQLDIIQGAIDLLDSIGYKLKPTYSTGRFKTNGVIAAYCPTRCHVCISFEAITTVEELAKTLMEEEFHNRGHRDGSRAFEQFLMSELLTAKLRILELEKLYTDKSI